MRILIAEDDNVSRLILETQLRSMNHVVVSTYDGLELVNTFRNFPNIYDVIITDVTMPNMCGLEAAREIKKIRDISVVALTAYGQETKILDNNGVYIPWTTCDYYLRKPTTTESIREVLSAVADDDYRLSKRAY